MVFIYQIMISLTFLQLFNNNKFYNRTFSNSFEKLDDLNIIGYNDSKIYS